MDFSRAKIERGRLLSTNPLPSEAHMKRKPLILASSVAVCAGCAFSTLRTDREVTSPRATAAIPAAPTTVTFTNLTHPDISPYWGRAKSEEAQSSITDPKSFSLRHFGGLFGINWLPVGIGDERPQKQTACGPLVRASLFVGNQPTTENDWGLIIAPENTVLVDTAKLHANALRVRPLHVSLRAIYERSGKYWEPNFWNQDTTANGPRFLLEAEVTPMRKLLESSANPLPCAGVCDLGQHDRNTHDVGLAQLPDRICAYGPWVQETLHGFRPEIHPAEALYWPNRDGTWTLLMIQDASGRFDGSDPGKWKTTYAPAGSPSNVAPGEQWLQQAMIGEFRVPFGVGKETPPQVTVIAASGLEAIGSNGYPHYDPPAGARIVRDDSIQVSELGSSSNRYLVIRAQLRGAEREKPFDNHGAFLLLRVQP